MGSLNEPLTYRYRYSGGIARTETDRHDRSLPVIQSGVSAQTEPWFYYGSFTLLPETDTDTEKVAVHSTGITFLGQNEFQRD